MKNGDTTYPYPAIPMEGRSTTAGDAGSDRKFHEEGWNLAEEENASLAFMAEKADELREAQIERYAVLNPGGALEAYEDLLAREPESPHRAKWMARCEALQKVF